MKSTARSGYGSASSRNQRIPLTVRWRGRLARLTPERNNRLGTRGVGGESGWQNAERATRWYTGPPAPRFVMDATTRGRRPDQCTRQSSDSYRIVLQALVDPTLKSGPFWKLTYTGASIGLSIGVRGPVSASVK